MKILGYLFIISCMILNNRILISMQIAANQNIPQITAIPKLAHLCCQKIADVWAQEDSLDDDDLNALDTFNRLPPSNLQIIIPILVCTNEKKLEKLYALPKLAKFSKTGKFIVTHKDTLDLYETSSGTHLGTLEKSQDFCSLIKWSPCDTYITSAKDTFINVWDVKKKQLLYQLPHRARMRTKFTPDEKYLVLKYANKSFEIHDAVTGKLLRNLGQETSTTIDSKIHVKPPGTHLACINKNGTTNIYRLADGISVAPLAKSFEGFSPDGQYCIASDDESISLYETDTFNHRYTITINANEFFSRFGSQNTKFLTGNNEGTPKIWNAGDGTLLCTFQRTNKSTNARTHKIPAPYLSQFIILKTELNSDSTQVTLETLQGTPLHYSWSFTGKFNEATFLPDTIHCIIRGAYNSQIKLLNLKTGSCIAELVDHNHIKTLLTADSQFLITQNYFNTPKYGVEVWRLGYPFDPDTISLKEIVAYTVLENNRKNKQPACQKALAILQANTKKGNL